METFARTGYRRASMDAIAKAARISRPGLYFLFESKEGLFREAVSHVLSQDLAAIERILADPERSLQERVLGAFDQWAGRYVGPKARDVPTVIADNPSLLDDVARAAPARFDALLTATIASRIPEAQPVVQTLSSVSVGLIHQVASRDAYLERLRIAIELLMR